MNKLLSVTESAILLGITKELLFAYVRNAPKKHLGENRKLITTVKDGQNYFSEEELLSFDEYLKSSWSKKGEQRPPIPSYIQEYLKVEIGGKCPISGKGYPLENAHISPYSESLNHHHHNIIRIANEEHTKIDNNVLPRHILKETKHSLVENLRNQLRNEQNRVHSSFNTPRPHPIFVGRLKKIVELISAMEFDKLVIIEGLGGIGKTQLLLNALENVKYHNPIIWVDIESIGSFSDLLFILNNAISQFTGDISSKYIIDTLKDVPFTFIFDSLEKLLINERDEVEDFIRALVIETNQIQVIVTTQIDLSVFDFPKKIIKLNGLDSGESYTLIQELIESEIEISTECLDYIIDFCNGHPLSIKLTISLCKFYHSPSQVIELLKKTGSLQHPIRNKHNKATSLNICLSTIYNCLTQEQENIIHYTKFFPAGLKLIWANKHFEYPSFLSDIAILQQFFFIEINRDQLDFERIYIPNPIRPFLQEKALVNSKEVEDDLQLDAITHIMLEAVIVSYEYIESGKFENTPYGILRIQDELPNLLEAFSVAKLNADYWRKQNSILKKEKNLKIISGIASSLGKFCFIKGFYEIGILFSQGGIEANIELNDFELASTQYMYLSQLQSRQFDLEGFRITVEKMNEIALKTNNIEIKINATWAKGRLEFDKQNYETALNYYQIALKFLKETKNIKDDDAKITRNDLKGNIALLEFDIAKIYEFTGNYKEAIRRHQEVININIQINDDINLPSSYHHVANCFCKEGLYEEGFDYYFKAIKGFKNTEQYEYLANSISDLGLYCPAPLSRYRFKIEIFIFVNKLFRSHIS